MSEGGREGRCAYSENQLKGANFRIRVKMLRKMFGTYWELNYTESRHGASCTCQSLRGPKTERLLVFTAVLRGTTELPLESGFEPNT